MPAPGSTPTHPLVPQPWTEALHTRYPRLGTAPYPVALPPGWEELVANLFADLDRTLRPTRRGRFAWRELRCTDGALRAAYTLEHLSPALEEALDARVRAVIAASQRTCEQCGARGQLWAAPDGTHRTACTAHGRGRPVRTKGAATRRRGRGRDRGRPFTPVHHPTLALHLRPFLHRARGPRVQSLRARGQPKRLRWTGSAPPIQPSRQGDLDGLCGVYAVVNACRALAPELDRAEAEDLFIKLVSALHPGTRHPLRLVWQGVSLRTLRQLLRIAADTLQARLGVVLQVRRLKMTSPRPSLPRLWEALGREVDGSRVAIVGLGGSDDHWTVVYRVGRRKLRLLDSDRYGVVHRSRCTLQPTRTRTRLLAREIIVIGRADDR